MGYECFNLDIAEGVAHVRFSRPDSFNSFTPAFWRELPAAINEISESAGARVIVLSAEGKHFTSGMDKTRFPRLRMRASRSLPLFKGARWALASTSRPHATAATPAKMHSFA